MIEVSRRVWHIAGVLSLMSLPLACPGQESDSPEQDAGASAELSIYDTLVFDRPQPLSGGITDVLAENSLQRAAEQAPPTYDYLIQGIYNYELAISELEYQGGAWDAALTEPLRDMAVLLEEQGTYQEAVDAYARAIHVTRVNQGLDNLEQIPMVEKLIDNYVRLGEWSKADQYQNYLYYTQKKAFGADDPRMVPVLDRLATWNLRVFNARWGDAVGLRLTTAFYLYSAASRIVSVHFGKEDHRYVDYLQDTAGTAYLIARNQRLIEEATQPEYRSVQEMYADEIVKIRPITEEGYREGLLALQGVVEYYAEHGLDSADYAESLIHEADWYLLFERRRTAADKYLEAWNVLAALDNGTELIQARLGTVQPLPVFSERLESITFTADVENIAPNARESGYIDVEFDVTSYGAVASLNVLTEETEANERVISALRRMIRDTVFRPRLENGELVRSEANRFRYAYWY